MKKMKEQLSPREEKDTLNILYRAARAIKSDAQMEDFLKQILTDSEKLMLGRRVWIAQLLLQGKTHREVCAELKVGPSTVHRVSVWLDGQLPGYAEAVTTKPRRKKKNDYTYEDYSGFRALRKKYPGHFLLFNLVEELVKRAK